MNKPRKRLPRKLSITLILLAVPVFVVSLGTFFNHVQDLLHDEAMKRSTSILNTTMQRVVNYMNTIQTAAKANAWLIEANFNPDSLQSISNRIVRYNGSVQSCSVSTEPDVFPQYGRYFSVYSFNDGDTIITTCDTDYDYFSKQWYQTPRQSGKAWWIDPFSDFNEGSINVNDAVASYCIPLYPNGGRIAGVISTEFSFNRLAEVVTAADHPFPSSYYMLLGTNGRYLIHPNTSFLFKKTIFSANDSIQHPDVFALGHEMMSGKRGVMHITKDNKLYHVCYAPLPGTHASLALLCLDEEILSNYYHLTHLILLIVAIGLLFILLITYGTVRHNIKPIDQLLDATQKMADGNYNEVIPLTNQKDIVSKLNNAFAEMQQAIISYDKSIDHTTEEIKKESEELELAMQQAEESAKKKQQFVQNLLRQIHKPLNVIEGLTQVLLKSLSLRSNAETSQKELQTKEISNITSTMKNNAYHLNRMMLMLYDSSETRAFDEEMYQRNEDVSCNEVVRECIEHTKTNYPDAVVRFETELPDSISIRTNHLYLMRSIREVLYNAAKYSDGKHIAVRVSQAEAVIRFIIEDKGPGLSEEWQETISQPFIKGEELSAGLGLGLPLTKHHVASLGGKFIYDTNYHEGCRIIFEMPK